MLDILNHPSILHSCLMPNTKNWLKHLDIIFHITEVTCFSETVFEKALLGNRHLRGLEKEKAETKKQERLLDLLKI